MIALLAIAAALTVLPDRSARQRVSRNTSRLGSFRLPPAALVIGLVGIATALVVGVGVGIAVVCASATARVRWTASRAASIRSHETAWLAAGLDVMVADVTVGAHPVAACEAAAREIDGSAAEAFAGAAARGRLGGSAAEAVHLPGTPIDAELERLSAVWIVAEKHGLPLAALLDAARQDIQGRSRFRRRTEAALAGARATALVLAALPVLGIALGQMMGASPLGVLLGDGFGGILTAIGVGLVCAGLLWTDRITSKVTA